MGFFLGLFLGISLGIGCIICLVRAQNIRSQRRSHLATTVAAFAKMTVLDSKKVLPPEYYPPWVVFLQRQKLTWLNLQLKKIWPYVNEAASALIRDIVEPILEQYRPAMLSALTFSKLTLGTVAPQLTGISVIEGDIGAATLEVELQWDGNPKIVLDVKTNLGVVLPIKVKNIGFTGVFRLTFKPLVDEFPCFGAICYSLKEKKKLDFELIIVGSNISTIPGLFDAIEESIRDTIEGSITWPVQKILSILPGDYSDLELKPVGTLEVKLVQGKELSNKDIIGKSDPYAVLFIRPLRDKMKRSKTINNELNPVWNEHFKFTVEDASTQHLTIRVFDDEGVQASQLIGCAQVPLKHLEAGKVKDLWLKLVKNLEVQRDSKYRGQVHLELLYCPFGTVSEFTNPYNPDFSLTILEKVLKNGTDRADVANISKADAQKERNFFMRGVLSVTVICAEDLPAVDVVGKSDAYVVLVMKKSGQKQKTRVLNNNLNPVWNQTFNFVVEDGLHELLILEVWDHDIFGKEKIGQCIMTMTRAISEVEFTDIFTLDGAKSGKLHLHVKWTPQPIFRDP